jgi:hypothetical protein
MILLLNQVQLPIRKAVVEILVAVSRAVRVWGNSRALCLIVVDG